MVKEKSQKLKDDLKPLIANINGIEDVATGLLAVGYEKIEHINNFLDVLVDAEMYFKNGGPLFSKPARRKHVEKLDELIVACNTMHIVATTKMAVFKAVILGGNTFAEEQSKIDGHKYEEEIAAEQKEWLEEMKKAKATAGKLMLQNLVIRRGILNKNMEDNMVFLM